MVPSGGRGYSWRRANDGQAASQLVLSRRDGESDEQAYARHTLKADLNAALTIQEAAPSVLPVEIKPLMDELAAQSAAVNDGSLARGEAMLTAQAHTLDALFHRLVRVGLRNMQEGYLDAADRYMRLGFKAQSQCRSAWEAIAEIKNPGAIAFVKQANIGQAVQVNNGIAAPRARETESAQNKLLEANDGERLDTGTASAAGRANPDLESLGTINRAANARGQGQG